MQTRRRRTRLRSSLALATAAVTVGCHSYVPVDAAAVAPSRVVRLDLTDAGSVALGPGVGRYAVSVDGRISQHDDSALVVAVSQVTRRSGAEEAWNGESVRVPRSGVSSVTIETLSRSRTYLVVGGLAALGATIGAAFGGGGGTGGRTPAPPPGGNK